MFLKRKQLNKTTGAGASLALAVALATGGAMMGVSSSAHAVNIAHDNLGEVLVFPYYTVRNGWATYFNITNTSDTDTVVAKVRWREGKNSRDVRDFNVYLSPNDVWVAAILPTADGATLRTNDTSCTDPALPAVGNNTGIDFTNVGYSAANADTTLAQFTTLDRTREGYFEVISMGVAAQGTSIANNALHVGNNGNNTQRPRNCNAIRALNESQIKAILSEPENLLKGRAVLINSVTGASAGYDPLVLANFHNPTVPFTSTATDQVPTDGLSTNDIYADPETEFPNLANAAPATAVFINDTTGDAVSVVGVGNTPRAQSVDAVGALIMRNRVINDYNIRSDSETDWVVTMPTKHYLVDSAAVDGVFADRGANHDFAGENDWNRARAEACVNISLDTYDREEYTPPEQEPGFSPAPPPGVADSICNEVNVLSFGGPSLTQSQLTNGRDVAVPADNGWARLSFPRSANGLPVIGFRFEKRVNPNIANREYSFANDHAYNR